MKVQNRAVSLRYWYGASHKVGVDTYIRDIPIGTVFIGNMVATGPAGGIFLRDYIGVVDLEDPIHTWKIEAYSTLVRNYQPIDVELIITKIPGEYNDLRCKKKSRRAKK